MAKITKVPMTIFGSSAPSAGAGSVQEFGLLASGGASSPYTGTSNLLNIMTTTGIWALGWLNAVIGNNGPALEDMNAFCFVVTTQLAYAWQAGIPEWDATTIYYTGSYTNVAGILYRSLQDSNQNNTPSSSPTYWAIDGGNVSTVTTNTSMAAGVDVYRVNAAGGNIVMSLPSLASSKGVRFKVKRVDNSANTVTLQGNSSDNIDAANTMTLQPYNSVDLAAYTTSVWDVV